MPSFELLAIICLVALAFGDLIVGVVNDAVNFLNSAIGAKVASRRVIMTVACVGVIIGVTFSDGIIEVARKGIFSPEFFTNHEAILIFTAVAITDIILLDLYSTFGLPTSTTVSIVFELFGAALMLAFWKMGGFTEAWGVINSSSAIKIIVGILLSVGVSFAIGFIAQFITRMIFTFDYRQRLKRYGFLWSGVALTALVFFILIKGSKNATFMTPEIQSWIAGNTLTILIASFVVFSLISFILIRRGVKILKLIVLIGTGSLAMAFAGNDLANFIGVSVAGMHAFFGADLSGTLPTPTWVLILAGLIMSAAMIYSKKARTVVNTSLNLASHEKGVKDHWRPNIFVNKLTNIVIFFGSLIPLRIRNWVSGRLAGDHHGSEFNSDFDKIRAAVNLMVAAAIISYATSKKLPLSTTYVTFMVIMGTSLADGAWDRDSAPHRIAGVLTVVGGWFLTAIVAFVFAGIMVTVLYFGETVGLIFLMALVFLSVWKLFHVHKRRESMRGADC